jgi:phage recombination protein Bet
MQYLFEIVTGKPPIPRLLVDAQGQARSPDNRTLFSIEEAVKRTGFSADYLRELWIGTLADFAAAPLAQQPQPDPAAPRISALRKRYEKFSDEHFNEFIELCELRKLNPFANQVYGILHFDRHRDRQVVELIIGIEGMRLMAHRTREYAGCDKPEYSYNADDKPNATVTLYRLVGGTRQGFTGEALWDEFAPKPQVDEVWDTKPHVCIGKCAEAAALRKAFPQEIGGLYTPEEWSKSQDQEKSRMQRMQAAKPDPDSQIDPRVEEYSQV